MLFLSYTVDHLCCYGKCCCQPADQFKHSLKYWFFYLDGWTCLALNLLLNFDTIEKGVRNESTEIYGVEYSSFGLLVTVVFYLEILRLLSKFKTNIQIKYHKTPASNWSFYLNQKAEKLPFARIFAARWSRSSTE